MRLFCAVALSGGLLTSVAQPATAQADTKPSNRQVPKAGSREEAVVISFSRLCAQLFPPFDQIPEFSKLMKWKQPGRASIAPRFLCTPPEQKFKATFTSFVDNTFGYPVVLTFGTAKGEGDAITTCAAELVDGNVEKAVALFDETISAPPQVSKKRLDFTESAWSIRIRGKLHRMALLDYRASGKNDIVLSVCDDQSYFKKPSQ